MGEKKKREKIMLQGEKLGLMLTEMLGHPGNKSILSDRKKIEVNNYNVIIPTIITKATHILTPWQSNFM